MADRFLDLMLACCEPLSAREKLLMRDVCGSPQMLMRLGSSEAEAVLGRRLRGRWEPSRAACEAEKIETVLADGRIKCLFLEQAGYPAQLAEIYDPPYALYYRGRLPDWERPSAAVVGTRLPAGGAVDAAYATAYEFACEGVTVVSGLASGIDSSAHSGNIDGGAATVAILGSGCDEVYPVSNRPLARRILETGGCLASEYPPGTQPRKHHFPQRNRIISGLSRAVVVVDAPEGSGAFITADFALEQGRDLYVHEAGLFCRGNTSRLARMVFDGAPVINSAHDVLADWGYARTADFCRIPEEAADERTAGMILADRMEKELEGLYIKFNGKYFRRAYNEGTYAVDC